MEMQYVRGIQFERLLKFQKSRKVNLSIRSQNFRRPDISRSISNHLRDNTATIIQSRNPHIHSVRHFQWYRGAVRFGHDQNQRRDLKQDSELADSPQLSPLSAKGKSDLANSRRSGFNLNSFKRFGRGPLRWEACRRGGRIRVGMVEPRILPNQIQEAIKSTWCLVHNHHYAALFDENKT
jgi:hypothetical protein